MSRFHLSYHEVEALGKQATFEADAGSKFEIIDARSIGGKDALIRFVVVTEQPEQSAGNHDGDGHG